MQCRLFSPGKVSSHNTALPRPSPPPPPPPCAAFLCFHTIGCEAYSFTTDGHGIFNLSKKLGACRTHEDGSGTNKSAQELTRRCRTSVVHSTPLQGIEPRVFGYEFGLCNHWATSLVTVAVNAMMMPTPS